MGDVEPVIFMAVLIKREKLTRDHCQFRFRARTYLSVDQTVVGRQSN